MSLMDWVLLGLWALLALGVILNWRAQARWHRHYMERLGPDGVTKSPVRIPKS